MSYKVVFLGEGRVGKTSIGKRWAQGKFEQGTRSTVAAGFFQKSVFVDSKTIDIQLLDTAGQEEYHSLAPIYYKDAHAAILVFSCTDQKSFERTQQWKKELNLSRGDDIKLFIVANKIDLSKDRVVTTEQGENYARSINCPYFEVSAKSGQGIETLFNQVAQTLSQIPLAASKKTRSKVGLEVVNGDQQANPQNKKDGCC